MTVADVLTNTWATYLMDEERYEDVESVIVGFLASAGLEESDVTWRADQ